MGTSITTRLTLEQFYREYEDKRAYLIDGVVYEMTPPNPLHETCVTELANVLRGRLLPGLLLREEKSLPLGEATDPQPDIAVLLGDAYDYIEARPTAHDTLLVVEVADSSLASDRRRKLPRYAAAGIPEAWIVNLRAGVLETYRRPNYGSYSLRHEYRAGEQVAPLFLKLDGNTPRLVIGRWVGGT